MLAEPVIAAKRTAMRRLPALLLIALALVPAACREQPSGAVRTVVIGGQPQMRDPAAGPLSTPDAVLVHNVAQGLVGFDASGNIVAGLAERWNVSDDGMSYIFRIASAQWPDGRKITAPQIAKVLKRYFAPKSKDPLKDTLGAVDDVVAMTDRVIEIRLIAPRPNLLPLLAQPEMAILRGGQGTGPFTLAPDGKPDGELHLTREIATPDEEVKRREEVLLSGAPAPQAVTDFANGTSDLVLGGTFTDLPFAWHARLPRNSLRFDPASGLFGLVAVAAGGGIADPELRKLLSQAIDRDALVAALGVPGLAPRTTLLEPGLDGVPAPTAPAWTATALADRLPALKAQAARMYGQNKKLVIRLLLPGGPGGDMLLRELARDWGALGFTVERAPGPGIATFALIDEVAPSSSPAWFVRRFRCGAVAACDPDADKLMEAARGAPVPAQRYALLAQAAGLIDDATLYIPLTAPVRWSLVSRRIQNFAGNRYARHTLTDLEQRPGSED
jgi:peptide/nickel transport system substrate-binding protein